MIDISGLDSLLNTGLILLALVALETVLSADNAVALAALVQPLPTHKQQQQALNWGLAVAFIRADWVCDWGDHPAMFGGSVCVLVRGVCLPAKCSL